MNYAHIRNGELLDISAVKYLDEDTQNLEVSVEIYLAFSESRDKVVCLNGEVVLNPDFEEVQKQKEVERVANLKMTPRDFLLALTEDFNIDFASIETLLNSNSRAKIELNYCQYVYRKNPLLDQLCGQFNITSAQLDELFKEKGA